MNDSESLHRMIDRCLERNNLKYEGNETPLAKLTWKNVSNCRKKSCTLFKRDVHDTNFEGTSVREVGIGRSA